MRRLVVVTIVATLCGIVAGCPAKATQDDCANACANVTKLYLGAVDRESKSHEVLKSMGETGAAMAREMATLQLEFLREECEKECIDKATVQQTECLVSAQSKEDLNRCN